MKIYTYYDPDVFPRYSDESIIELWQRSWRKHGWNPSVLGPTDVPTWANKLLTLTDKFPAINPQPYERACFARWAAVAAAEGLWMVDYDVMNYGWHAHNPPERLTIYQDYNPALVSGGPDEFEFAIRFFSQVDPETPRVDARYWVKGRPHVSEQYILMHNPHLYQSRKLLRWCNIDADWMTAPLVHYAHDAIGGAGRLERERFIQTRRPV